MGFIPSQADASSSTYSWRTGGVNHGQNYHQRRWIWLVSASINTFAAPALHKAPPSDSREPSASKHLIHKSGRMEQKCLSIPAPPILLQQTSWRRAREKKKSNCSPQNQKKGEKKKLWAFDTLSLKEKYINDAPWQSALIREASPWTRLFIGHRFSSGFMASDTPRTLVAGRLLGNTLRGCHLSRHASCIIL